MVWSVETLKIHIITTCIHVTMCLYMYMYMYMAIVHLLTSGEHPLHSPQNSMEHSSTISIDSISHVLPGWCWMGGQVGVEESSPLPITAVLRPYFIPL